MKHILLLKEYAPLITNNNHVGIIPFYVFYKLVGFHRSRYREKSIMKKIIAMLLLTVLMFGCRGEIVGGDHRERR